MSAKIQAVSQLHFYMWSNVHIMCTPCAYHVLIMCISCAYHVHTMCIPCSLLNQVPLCYCCGNKIVHTIYEPHRSMARGTPLRRQLISILPQGLPQTGTSISSYYTYTCMHTPQTTHTHTHSHTRHTTHTHTHNICHPWVWSVTLGSILRMQLRWTTDTGQLASPLNWETQASMAFSFHQTRYPDLCLPYQSLTLVGRDHMII